MSKASKKYASPVNEYRHKRRHKSTAARRMIRAAAGRYWKAKQRRGKRHPSPEPGIPGRPYQLLEHKSTKEQVHATGALKRHERHPNRGEGARRRDLEWLYVCR